jgi:cytochrome c oxidase subunit 2
MEPPQVYGSMPIEIAWTAAPLLIAFVLALILTRAEFEVRVNQSTPPPGSKPLYVTVIGHQWWWEYIYDRYDGQDLGVITANELHVPASEEGLPRPVYLTLKSADVCHSFWVPRLAGKTDLIPGRTNEMWFQTKERGLFLGQCAEYCGTQHAHMLLRVNVDSPDEFQKWIADQRKPAVDGAAVRAGRDLFLSQTCVNCHRVRGTTAAGTYAPDLTHLMSRQTLASGAVPNTEEQLRKWLVDPQRIKEGCLMPAFGLSEEQVDLLVKYLGTLK